jgi:leucyl/phenylalanyl-tRNA---protein transferase
MNGAGRFFERLRPAFRFPPPEEATPDGLLAIGGDLTVERLLHAYAHGIFPWYSEGDPILWWCPDPRMVMVPDEFHVSRSLRRTLNRRTFTVTADRAFEDVIAACAKPQAPPRDSTWITPEMRRAFIALHHAGYAHSIETWQDGELAGGLYGVSLGACFFGESMFSRETDASKVAMHRLVELAKHRGWPVIDCQVPNEHLQSLGAREIPRAEFLALLNQALQHDTWRGRWDLG